MRIGIGAVMALGLAAAAGAAAIYLLHSFRHFESVEPAFAGRCTPVTGLAGPEDVEIDPVLGRAFISSFDRRNREAKRGGVYEVALDDPLAQANWRDRTGGVPEKFEPLGLNLYDDGETRRLFVVNAAARSVELYEIGEDGALAHLETFAERRLTSPNDVVAVGPRAFYVTNDFESGRDSLIARFEFLTRAASGKLMYFDGDSWRIAASGLKFANGVEISPNGRRVYVAETTGEGVKVFARDRRTGLLTLKSVVVIDGAVDNINVDEDGDLWIGAHLKPLLLPRAVADEDATAPSMIVRVSGTGENATAHPVFVDDGERISASTAAARYGRTLVIGSLVDRKFLLCELPPANAN